jgi:hypothetical protein
VTESIWSMTLQQFRDSLGNEEPPSDVALAVLWWGAKGNWARAHESAQQDEGPAGSWVHAYQTPQTRDTGTVAQAKLLQEWIEIAGSLLGEGGSER